MHLIDANYYKHTTAVRMPDGSAGTRTDYGYETASAAYEMANIGGSYCYRTNYGPWMIAPMCAIHRAVKAHFGLTYPPALTA